MLNISSSVRRLLGADHFKFKTEASFKYKLHIGMFKAKAQYNTNNTNQYI